MKAPVSFLLQQLSSDQIDATLLLHGASAMQARLAEKRAAGRNGWHGPDCDNERLLHMLHSNLDKGDMVDVMNLAAMIDFRHELYGEQTVLQLVEATAELAPAQGQILRLGANALALQVDDESPAAGYVDLSTNLMWGPTLGHMVKSDADQAIKDYRLFGFKDWRLPTRKELFSLIEDGRSNPACSPVIEDMKFDDAYWTAQPVPGNEDCFFVVGFGYGFVYDGRRGYHGWVRPVRSLSPAPSSQ